MTTKLSSREKAILVIFYLSRIPAPKDTDQEYLNTRFAKLLDFYSKKLFPEISKNTIIDLCREVRAGEQFCMNFLNETLAFMARPENGGFGLDKEIGVSDLNLKDPASIIDNPETTKLIEHMRKEYLRKLREDDVTKTDDVIEGKT